VNYHTFLLTAFSAIIPLFDNK